MSLTQAMRSFNLEQARNKLLTLRCAEQDALKAYQASHRREDQHQYAMARHERVYFESLSQDEQIAKLR